MKRYLVTIPNPEYDNYYDDDFYDDYDDYERPARPRPPQTIDKEVFADNVKFEVNVCIFVDEEGKAISAFPYWNGIRLADEGD